MLFLFCDVPEFPVDLACVRDVRNGVGPAINCTLTCLSRLEVVVGHSNCHVCVNVPLLMMLHKTSELDQYHITIHRSDHLTDP